MVVPLSMAPLAFPPEAHHNKVPRVLSLDRRVRNGSEQLSGARSLVPRVPSRASRNRGQDRFPRDAAVTLMFSLARNHDREWRLHEVEEGLVLRFPSCKFFHRPGGRRGGNHDGGLEETWCDCFFFRNEKPSLERVDREADGKRQLAAQI